MKKALSLLVVCFYTSVVAHSQFVTQEYKIFNHIDLGVTAGSTGFFACGTISSRKDRGRLCASVQVPYEVQHPVGR